MSLSETILRKTAEWKPKTNERQALVIADEGSGWTTTLTVDRNEDVACLLWELTLRRSAPEIVTTVTLPAWANQVVSNVTALEPLQVVEVDELRGQAQMRSVRATRSGDSLRYFEVVLSRGGEIQVRRFQGFPQALKQRQQVAFPLTHEALCRAVAELAGEQ